MRKVQMIFLAVIASLGIHSCNSRLRGDRQENPLFKSEKERTIYDHAYNNLLEKYDIKYDDIWVNAHLGKAHLLETGNKAGDPILLLHTAGVSAAEWYANLNALGKEFHILALDMPGDAGKSELARFPSGIADYAQTIVQILDSLKIARINLLGHSLGGFLATGFAIAHPERVEKLVLMSPAATHVPMHWYMKMLIKAGEGKPGKGPEAIKILKMQAYKGFVPEPAFVELMNTVRDYANVRSIFPYVYSKEKLASLTVPTTLIIGTEEVLCNHKKSVRLAKKKIPGIKVHIINNAGHTPNMEYPDKTNRLLLSVLKDG